MTDGLIITFSILNTILLFVIYKVISEKFMAILFKMDALIDILKRSYNYTPTKNDLPEELYNYHWYDDATLAKMERDEEERKKKLPGKVHRQNIISNEFLKGETDG